VGSADADRVVHRVPDTVLSTLAPVRVVVPLQPVRTCDGARAQPASCSGALGGRAVGTYRALILNLSGALTNAIERARTAPGQLFGAITIEQNAEGVVAEMTARPDRVICAGGAQIGLVAGAGFEPATFGLCGG